MMLLVLWLLDVVLVAVSIVTSESQITPLPEAWKKQILAAVQNFQVSTGVTIMPPSVTVPSTSTDPDPIAFLCPDILLWSPMEQFLLSDLYCPVCTAAGFSKVTLSPLRWQCGNSERTQPRKVLSAKGIVLLVSRVYKCTHSHEIIGHDPGIISCVKSWLVPFHLWHKTGITKDLVDEISILVDSGIPIMSVEALLMKHRRLDYIRRLTIFKANQRMGQEFLSFNDWSAYFPSISPGWHIICACFKLDFLLKEEWFTKHMQQMTINDEDGWLSCDHTFASAGNVGLSRDFDNRWITQYNSLFCVTNEGGQVVTWKLTKSVAFSNVEDLLLKLKDRFDKQGKVITEFYVDICCSWRSKLQQVFGENLKVYLDLFHAVKRVSSTISKKHPLHYACITALSMVFRDPTDHGPKRQKPTPSPAVMLENIRAFQQQWETQATNGKNVLTAASAQEISKLCKHIERGCLSGIKPGRGTNRNEALHKSLNAHFKASRYGVELAYMLLTSSFYQHNERVDAQSTGRKCKLVLEHTEWLDKLCSLDEVFGLIPGDCQEATTVAPNSVIETLSFNKASYCDIFTRFTSPEGGQAFKAQPPTGEESLPESNEMVQVSIKDSTAILLRALGWFSVYNTLSKYTSTATLSCTEIPFMKADFGYSLTWLGTDVDTSEENVHLSRLSNVLTSWNFRRIEVPGDGNCLFTSVAVHLQSIGPTASLNSILENLGINVTKDSVEQIASLLRQAVVAEWLGDHFSEYTHFLAFSQLELEAQRFLKSGEFAGDVGDLVVSALCNVLHSPIVLFTSIPNLPILVVTPSHEMMDNPQPIHLTFTQHGAGHYDLAVYHQSGPCPEGEQYTEPSKCTCGRKRQSGAACTSVLNKYTCRCPCYNTQKMCNDLCKCKNCQNPFGAREVHQVSPGASRKRRHQEVQHIPIRGTKTSKYLEESKVDYRIGSPNDFERLLVLSILHFLVSGAGVCEESACTEVEIVSMIFHTILGFASALCVCLPLFKRSLDDISKLIKSYNLKKKSL